MTGVRWQATGLLVVLVFSIMTSTAGAADRPTACGPADHLLEEGALSEALVAYRAIEDPCGAAGVQVVEQRQRAARSLVEVALTLLPNAGEPGPAGEEALAAATEAAQAATLLDPENEEAAAIVAGADPPPTPSDLCRAGNTALDRGDWQGAKELFAAAGEDEASEACAKAGAARAEQARLSTWPARIMSATSVVLPWLLLAALGFLAALVVTSFHRRPTWSAQAAALTSGPDDDARSGSSDVAMALVTSGLVAGFLLIILFAPEGGDDLSTVVQRALGGVLVLLAVIWGATTGRRLASQRRLTFAPFTGAEDVDTGGVTALSAAAFAAYGRPSKGIDVVTSGDDIDLPTSEVLALTPNQVITALVSLWRALTPATHLTMSGHVVDDGSGLRSAAVELRFGRRTVAAATITTRAFSVVPGKPSDLEKQDSDRDLAAAIGAWLVLAVYPDDPPPGLYGARTWIGPALNDVAQGRAVRDPAGARELLARAADQDPEYLVARFNFTNLRLRGTPVAAPSYRPLLEDLGKLRDTLAERSNDTTARALRWRVSYAYGAGWANLTKRPSQPGSSAELEARAVSDARTRATEVLTALKAELEAPMDNGDAWLVAALRRLVDTALLALRCSLLPAVPDREAWRARVLVDLEAEASVGPRVQRNLACAAVAASDSAHGLTGNSWDAFKGILLDRAVGAVRKAGVSEARRAQLRTDPWLTSLWADPEGVAILAEWTSPSSAVADYGELSCIGELAPELLELGYANQASLLVALSDATTAQGIREATGASSDQVRAWKGALDWYSSLITAELIDTVQRAGYPDRAALGAVAAGAAATRCAPWHRATGRSDEDEPTAARLQVMGAL